MTFHGGSINNAYPVKIGWRTTLKKRGDTKSKRWVWCGGDEMGEDIGWRVCVLITFPYGRGRREMRDC